MPQHFDAGCNSSIAVTPTTGITEIEQRLHEGICDNQLGDIPRIGGVRPPGFTLMVMGILRIYERNYHAVHVKRDGYPTHTAHAATACEISRAGTAFDTSKVYRCSPLM